MFIMFLLNLYLHRCQSVAIPCDCEVRLPSVVGIFLRSGESGEWCSFLSVWPSIVMEAHSFAWGRISSQNYVRRKHSDAKRAVMSRLHDIVLCAFATALLCCDDIEAGNKAQNF